MYNMYKIVQYAPNIVHKNVHNTEQYLKQYHVQYWYIL